ncbi:tRNA (N(6)-L-threonylcarbamoyladenosine(37)-C(2))-methylthiotransferase MtaB [Peptoniphilus sp. KCTC 25270]|uniref:tRNA (N(6)-L-threonylcarbamoyladenosine(37)-C(2))- methylthiotransferase MtaB n=1 Tax=Peptoniphilus sp. KCTC 25270 TaxID=2897414 RepID=UPI001E3AD193|nr:tRNA (N(6)-L-threonylcarbamoyladenosine(37)-C(2))-methylthiotransferase MtaB [Peptoniphilus sp. KCTC 25270]MCD1146855.1 tRNA (N(6)-L-threonylcarbamoyladenosine(37)-C(2))-methylthiotransferase MtaB [Peptoniphilus sp. KCTC 25270]
MNRFNTKTLGCKVNHYETEAIEEILEKSGFEKVSSEEPADVTIINTCTVTNMSDRKSRQIIRKAKRLSPNSVVVVLGCYAQVSPEEIEKIPEVDIIMGTSGREKLPEYIREVQMDQKQIIAVKDYVQSSEFESLSIENTSDRTRAYMKVQDGCNQYCSYCIIPYARGFIRSRDLEDSVAEAKRLQEQGFKEIVLTGIHVGSYGKDLEGDLQLIDLIEAIAKVEGIHRIRLSSVEPMTITGAFMKRYVDTKKGMDHFHLSLQSGCNKVLKEMNRKYTVEEYKEKVDLIRKYMPRAGITTDIIVGFPGETEEEFLETQEYVKEIGFSRIHVFPYSPRKGTPAAKRKDQIHGDEKQSRSHRLIETGEEMALEFIKKNVETPLETLFEMEEEGWIYGYTSNYIRVKAKAEKNRNNTLGRVKIKEVGTEPVLAEVLEEDE